MAYEHGYYRTKPGSANDIVVTDINSDGASDIVTLSMMSTYGDAGWGSSAVYTALTIYTPNADGTALEVLNQEVLTDAEHMSSPESGESRSADNVDYSTKLEEAFRKAVPDAAVTDGDVKVSYWDRQLKSTDAGAILTMNREAMGEDLSNSVNKGYTATFHISWQDDAIAFDTPEVTHDY